LDSPNLLCGRYRCSPGLTSLSESADHSGRSTTETSSPCPSGSPFSQSTSAWDSRKTNFRRAKRPELVPEADIVSQGTDLIIKSPGEAGRKLLGRTEHPRAPRRRRGMEKRGTSLAWPPLGHLPP
ncbi:hypothetical protein Celaphus_00018179, partial [Cervus elaphus hippelaphus]